MGRSLRSNVLSLVNHVVGPWGLAVVNRRRLVDYSLHSYSDYEEYKAIQTRANRRKIDSVWADERTLATLCRELQDQFPGKSPLTGICHGSRNGFEQRFLSEKGGMDVIGTDISDTAERFPSTRRWDFHEVNSEWVQRFDFVYSNALDHAWNPKLAVETWLNQLKPEGILALEHTGSHSPEGTSAVDPFGVRPTVLPYVLSSWFGYDISIRYVRSRKSNAEIDVWLFLVRKTGPGLVSARGDVDDIG